MNLAGIVAAAVLAVAAPAAAQPRADQLEIRFCPETVARPYPLDSLRGVQGLLLQNVAVINHGPPIKVEAIEIELLNSGQPIDSRLLAGPAITAAVGSGQAVKGAGMLEAVAFQFCNGRLLDGAHLTDDETLQTGEGLLVMQQVFAWKGGRDELRVTARALDGDRPVAGRGSVRLDGSPARTAFRWPLKGDGWVVGAAASFHTTHRWAVPEEFALDIMRLGADLRTHRGDGTDNADFHAYGAEVVAAADGVVADLVTGSTEAPPMLPRPGETLADYYARIGAQQAINLAGGLPGLAGDSVILDHGNGEFSVYAHLKPGSITVRKGQAVRAGETIGLLGSSGNSTEPHLHFQVCDRPSPIDCAALRPAFEGIAILNSDGPRPLQSGDIVRVH